MGRRAAAAPATSTEKSSAEDPKRVAIIDEFGMVDTELAAVKSKIQRRDELRQMILGWYPFLAADQTKSLQGQRFDLEITRRDNLTEVSQEGKKKLRALWGLPEFLKRCSVTLKQLDNIPKDRHPEYVETQRKGPRHLRVMPRTPQPQA